MYSLIITGGEAPPLKYIAPILQDATFIVAADSGWNKCREWNILPHVLVGDMDSIEGFRGSDYPDLKIETHREDKDHSDTQLALDVCSSKNQPVYLIGGGEGRMDHWLALVDLMKQVNAPDRWITAREDCFIVQSASALHCSVDLQISLFPLNSKEWDCRTRGLQWDLDSRVCQRFSHSLSNRTRKSRIEIDPRGQRILLIMELSLDGPQPSLPSID